MLENPGDEVYFGEIYRTVLQEAWLPEGAEVWQRTGKSRRGRRPPQQGLGLNSPSPSQADIRACFTKCKDNWNDLPWEFDVGHPCYGSRDKSWWKDEKDDAGVPCGYYDYYMRWCLKTCFETGCPPDEGFCFVWAPSNPSTLTCPGPTPVFVIGGTAPFSWSISGPNMTLADPQTTGASNVINADAPCCAAAVVDVTDACGRQVQASLTTSAGFWDRKWSGYATRGPTPHCRRYVGAPDKTAYAKQFRYHFIGYLRMCSIEGHSWPTGLDPDWYPPCGTPATCAGGRCTISNCYGCPPCQIKLEQCDEPCAKSGTFMYHHMSVDEYTCP